MQRYCDLHTHSVYSDGTCTPAEILDLAEAAGLSAVALCDHNTVSGLPEFLAAAQGRSVEAVGGIELSAEYLGRDIHIVGLYIPPERYGDIAAMMEDYNRRKKESTLCLIESLREHGYPLDTEEIFSRNRDGNINRAHIAAALIEKGYVASIKEAFETVLDETQGYYVPPRRLAVLDAISYLRSIGAVPILAHPFLDLTEEELEVFLPGAKEAGLVGMETLYSCFDRAERDAAARIAEKFGLLNSGGSDFHGGNKPDIRLGTGRGDLYVPDHFLAALRAKKSR